MSTTPRPTTPYGLCAECHRMDWHRVTCSFHDGPAVNEHDALVAFVESMRNLPERVDYRPCADCFHPACMMATDIQLALTTLDAALGATS